MRYTLLTGGWGGGCPLILHTIEDTLDKSHSALAVARLKMVDIGGIGIGKKYIAET